MRPAPSRRAADIEAVAKSYLTYVRRNGRNGRWVAGSEAYSEATEECRELEWVRYISEKPRARIPLTRVIKRLMENHFCDIERQKRGPHRSAQVFFRVRQ